jgi:hypothetical protein
VAFDTAMPLGQENLGAKPVLGTLKATPNMYKQQCKVPRHETRQTLASKKEILCLALLASQNI